LIAGEIKHSETLNCTGTRKSKNRKDEVLRLFLVQRIRDKQGRMESFMDKHENHSEVARLMQQINEANEAAYQALYGLAAGVSRHEFITAKMERIGECHKALKVLVGEHEANMLLAETLEQAGTGQVAERIA
jgi:hypothetical protein